MAVFSPGAAVDFDFPGQVPDPLAKQMCQHIESQFAGRLKVNSLTLKVAGESAAAAEETKAKVKIAKTGYDLMVRMVIC